MRSLPALSLAVLVLTGCATGLQLCERAATADLRALDARIADTEEALARGYRILPAQQGVTRLRLCAWPREPVLFCTEQVQQPKGRQRQVIDPATEQRRLQAMRQERAELVIITADAFARCSTR